MKSRDVYFDNVKFALITLVCLGHIICPLSANKIWNAALLWIYFFHMPLFIFISGYFSKSFRTTRATTVITKLVIPYLIFETLYSIYDFLLFGGGRLQFSYLVPHWIMWYLFSLTLWRILLPWVSKNRYILPLAVVVGIAAGYFESIGYYASLSRTLVFFPFFLAGYFFRKDFLTRFRSLKFKLLSLGILGGAFLALLFLGSEIKIQWLHGSYSYEAIGFPGWFAGCYRLIYYLLAALLAFSFLLIIPQKEIPFFSKWGQNTIYVYLGHGFLVKFLVFSDFYTYLPPVLSPLVLIVLSLAICIVLSLNIVRKMLRPLVEPQLNFIFANHKNNRRMIG